MNCSGSTSLKTLENTSWLGTPFARPNTSVSCPSLSFRKYSISVKLRLPQRVP